MSDVATVYDAYLSALLAGDRRACRRIVVALAEGGTPMRAIYADLFQRSLYAVGELWERNRISVADEHLATAITESLMTHVSPVLFEAEHTGHTAVVACVASEYHQIGGRMVADTFELHGWHGHFLGANTPLKDLLALTDAKQPDVVALSLTLFTGLDRLIETATALIDRFPALPLWIGGQAIRWGGGDLLSGLPGVELVGSLGALEARIGGGSEGPKPNA